MSSTDNEQAIKILGEWGLVLERRPLMMDSRTLEPEHIILKRTTFPTNLQCDWGKNLGNDILNPVKIQSWLLVYTERNAAQAREFTTTMLEVSKRMGIQIGQPKVAGLSNDRTDTYVNRIRDEINPDVTLL